MTPNFENFEFLPENVPNWPSYGVGAAFHSFVFILPFIPIIIQNGQLNTGHQLGQINHSPQIINHQTINTTTPTASSSSGTLLPQLTGSHQPKIQTGIAQSATQLQHQIQGLTSINGLSSITGLSNGLQSSTTQFINTPQLYTIIQSGQIPGITTTISSGGSMTIPQLTLSLHDKKSVFSWFFESDFWKRSFMNAEFKKTEIL